MGGLVGANSGDIIQSHTTGLVCGNWQVGGLAGQNWDKAQPPRLTRLAKPGVIADCYSLCFVCGKGIVGGLVGDNERGGSVERSYSAGLVEGAGFVGGLVGRGIGVTGSFWDMLTSGQTASAGGTGLATCEMQMLHTFLDAGWDFTREEGNGTDDTWWMPGGWDYPKLAYKVSFPEPCDGATDVLQLPFLRWVSDRAGVEHDIYLGNDESAVLSATSQNSTVYRGRQSAATTLYDPGTLELGKTYYWRIDGVNVIDFNNPWRGRVWRFSLADFAAVATVDDFESYTNDTNAGEALFQTWTDGTGFEPLIGTGSLVGNIVEPFAGQTIVHGGRQSMPVIYNNAKAPWYSQVERAWARASGLDDRRRRYPDLVLPRGGGERAGPFVCGNRGRRRPYGFVKRSG